MMNVPRLSNKETLILKMLTNGRHDMYGLELVGESDGLLKRGTVYVTLGRMETKGYISSRKEAHSVGARGTARRLYKIMGLGERVLSAHEYGAAHFAVSGA